MFEKGVLIVYGTSGVYRVEEVGPIHHIRGCDPSKKYYKLSSARRGELIYVPVDTGVFMRPVISREQAEALLGHMGELGEDICESRDPRVLREHYQKIMEAHSCEELCRLIKSVNSKGRRAAAMGKRLGKTDQEYKKRAETLLGEELSAAMELPYDCVRDVLSRTLKVNGTLP